MAGIPKLAGEPWKIGVLTKVSAGQGGGIIKRIVCCNALPRQSKRQNQKANESNTYQDSEEPEPLLFWFYRMHSKGFLFISGVFGLPVSSIRRQTTDLEPIDRTGNPRCPNLRCSDNGEGANSVIQTLNFNGEQPQTSSEVGVSFN